MSIATLPTATVDDLLRWKPCEDWTASRIRDIASDRTEWTALDVLALEQVPATDRLWVVLRPELIPKPLLHELACRFAEQVLPIWEREYPDDRRPHEAIAAKRAWMRDEINDWQLKAAGAAAWIAARTAARAAARAAAWTAARAAAGAAAWTAARDAARDAAGAAAWIAARTAAGDAAWTAARDAAGAAAWDRQVEIVRELLCRDSGGEE